MAYTHLLEDPSSSKWVINAQYCGRA